MTSSPSASVSTPRSASGGNGAPLSFDDGALYYVTAEGNIIFGAVRDSDSVLVFDHHDGSFHVDTRYDEFSPTASKVVEEHRHYGILGILDLHVSKHVIAITAKSLAAKVRFRSVWRVSGVNIIQVYRKSILSLDEEEHEAVNLRNVKRVCVSGSMFFSIDVDLTNGPQRAVEVATARGFGRGRVGSGGGGACGESGWAEVLEKINRRFLYNKHLLTPLLTVETFPFAVPVICGHVGSIELTLTSSTGVPVFNNSVEAPINIVVVSRFTTGRAGTPFRRGVDEMGNVAVEVETETIVFGPQVITAHTQLRGSVPLLWRLLHSDGSELDISEADSERSLKSLALHLDQVAGVYGGDVTIIDLLHLDDKEQVQLGEIFEKCLLKLKRDDVEYVHCDGSRLLRQFDVSVKRLLSDVGKAMVRQGYFSCATDLNERFVGGCLLQKGIFRVNGFDCVDTTNIVQHIIGEEMTKQMIRDTYPNARPLTSSQLSKLAHIWADNANSISIHHQGTPALHIEYITCNSTKGRRGGGILWQTFGAPVFNSARDAAIKLSRSYLQVFHGDAKQEAFEAFLGDQQSASIEAAAAAAATAVDVEVAAAAAAADDVEGISILVNGTSSQSTSHLNNNCGEGPSQWSPPRTSSSSLSRPRQHLNENNGHISFAAGTGSLNGGHRPHDSGLGPSPSSSLSPTSTFSSSATSSPSPSARPSLFTTTPEVKSAILKRRRIQLHENTQSTITSSLLFLRRVTAPAEVSGPASLAAAVAWLGIYKVMMKSGIVGPGVISMTRRGSVEDLGKLPIPERSAFDLRKEEFTKRRGGAGGKTRKGRLLQPGNGQEESNAHNGRVHWFGSSGTGSHGFGFNERDDSWRYLNPPQQTQIELSQQQNQQRSSVGGSLDNLEQGSGRNLGLVNGVRRKMSMW